jgi:hypothetical protein
MFAILKISTLSVKSERAVHQVQLFGQNQH